MFYGGMSGILYMQILRTAIGRIVEGWRNVIGAATADTGLLNHVSLGPGQHLSMLNATVPTDRDPDFLIVRGSDELAKLWEDEEQTDFPWVVCVFDPTPAFSELETLFKQRQDCLVAGACKEANEIALAIEETGLKVVVPNDLTMPDMSLGLQIADGWAWFRLRPSQ